MDEYTSYDELAEESSDPMSYRTDRAGRPLSEKDDEPDSEPEGKVKPVAVEGETTCPNCSSTSHFPELESGEGDVVCGACCAAYLPEDAEPQDVDDLHLEPPTSGGFLNSDLHE